MKLCLWLVSGIFLCWSCQSKNEATPIYIATAANMQLAMENLVTAFEAAHEIDCEIVLNSSGKLSVQIQSGAPYDLFLAADQKYPESVCTAGLCAEPPRTYAFGRLVLWTNLKEKVDWEILNADVVQFLAIANPKTAPYGRAAKEVLVNQQLWNDIKPKIVMGESIAQTNQFLLTGAVQAGLTARSVVAAAPMNESGQWILIDKELHQPIRQDAVLLMSAKPEARLFYEFLFSEEAKTILMRYGYEV